MQDEDAKDKLKAAHTILKSATAALSKVRTKIDVIVKKLAAAGGAIRESLLHQHMELEAEWENAHEELTNAEMAYQRAVDFAR